MSISHSYAVFGLGRYGRAVALELVKSGADVIAVDVDEGRVNDAVSVLPVCKCADITDPEVIERLGIRNVDVVIVAMASSLEASVMAVAICKEIGVPTVIAKCGSEMHQTILSRVGADRVVLPEYESGVRLAKNLLSSGFMDIIELTKDVSKLGEESKVAVRNVRRDALDKFKAAKKKSEISEDELANLEDEMQKITDKFVKEIEKICESKNKEIMEL